MCHRFTPVSRDEADRVVDFLRAVRRALAQGMAPASVEPPRLDGVGAIPWEAVDCFPGSECAVVESDGGDLVRTPALWGVEVPWKRGLVFNARVESVLSGEGMWADAARHGRCVVPVRAFYETRNVEPPQHELPDFGGAGGKASPVDSSAGEAAAMPQPPSAAPASSRRKPQYRFASTRDMPLLLAGLHLGDRFVLVTAEPNPAVAPVHNRMPLVLGAPEALMWLDGPVDAPALLSRCAHMVLSVQEEKIQKDGTPDDNQLSLF